MGARERARKRGKPSGKAAKGSLKGSPVSQKKSSSSVLVSSLDPRLRSNALLASSSLPTNGNGYGYSMNEQARNTERHVFGWGATKLRGNAISFVSAGHLKQDELQTPQVPEENSLSSQNVAKEHQPRLSPQLQDDDVGEREGAQEAVIVEPSEATASLLDAVHKPLANPNSFGPPRTRSESVSSSGSEKIVFTGRSNTARAATELPLISKANYLSSVDDPNLSVTKHDDESSALHTSVRTASSQQTVVPAYAVHRNSVRRIVGDHRRQGRRRPQAISDEEEAIMQDYIANMAMDDTEDSEDKTSKPVRRNEHFRSYNGSGEEHIKVQLQSLKSETPKAVSSRANDLDQAMDWNSDDLDIFDEISTSEEEVEEIHQVLRHRVRLNDTQYLVTPKGYKTSDAKWIPQSKLTSESATREIKIFQEMQTIEFEEESFDEDDDSLGTSDDEALHDLVEHIESEDDENAKILAHTSRMTDEQIARALAKQEELGLGSDELVLFDGVAGDDAAEQEDLDAFKNGGDFIAFNLGQHSSNRTRSKRNKKQRDTFPSASAFADALDEDPYNGFDVMDFERPSLRPRKKGRKSDFPYELEVEDEELKDQLVSTWMKDREKKAQRKRDREEARQATIFDASERGDPAIIKAEIRRFLCQEVEVLKLAPMEAHVRASVHRIAKALKLNSRSEGKDGKGAGRYPVLTKTVRTPSYTVESIWEVDALMNTRRFFSKGPGGYKAKPTTTSTFTRARRSGGIQGASYMNGEVVGGSAPELGVDNKGRAMLEKMGWTSGMGIGAEGNKGSLEVIKHVVKTTKAGLG